ncbi:MAG: hypothetical protein DI630_12600 [Gordonia sp. (in: high G+C Gram-positive bacteria)]|nr:MAG: hypothetical protein DI630_12600 [Gordonia sp. (in: high G+C Gram-positive bacteria)]
MTMSNLATALTAKNNSTLDAMQAAGARAQEVLGGPHPSQGLREEAAAIEHLEGQRDALAFALEILRHGKPDNTIPAFLNRRLLEHITNGAELEQIRGFASVITDVLLTLGD